MKNILLLSTALLFVGCTSLQTVSLTSIPAQRSNVVKAQTEKTIFLGFNFDNDFVDQMESQLKNKCQNGQVTGILTKDEVVDYFLMIVWKHRVTATGYCVKAGTASNSFKDPRHPADENATAGAVDEGQSL